jgi:hypothetical protein
LFEQSRWSKWAWLEIGAGFVWLSTISSFHWAVAMPVWVVGSTFLATGISHLLWPGDLRVSKFSALMGLVGSILAIPYGIALGATALGVLLVTSLAAAWAAGRMSLHLEAHVEGAPPPVPTLALSTKVAIDELVLGVEQFQTSGFTLDGTIERIVGELREAHARFHRDGLLDKPENYHRTPPVLVDPEIRQSEAHGHRVEVLRFESGYAPLEGEPGRGRWLGYESCRDGWAYVMRHPGPPRPWLICTNGYRMGYMGLDVRLFERFFAGSGLNVLIPVLPLHGPRRRSWHSGTGFLGIDVIDTMHAEAQSIWDMRRLLSWIRSQDAPSVGAFGISLGGYTTALFASVAEELACAIPGIPLADIPRMVLRHGEPHQVRYAQHLGFDLDLIEETLRVVSPLVLEPKVALGGRLIFGANADRLVTPDQVVDLWRHWEEPDIVWYSGSHVSFLTEPDVWGAVDRKLRDTGVAV